MDTLLLERGADMSDLWVQSLWTTQEAWVHMSLLELKAVLKACESFLHHIRRQTVQMTDNTAVIFCIVKRIV